MTDGVKLSQLIAAASRRGSHLANETGLFIVLQAAEAMRDSPMALAIDSLHVTAEGAVVLVDGGKKSDESSAVQALLPIAEAVVKPMPSAMSSVLERARTGKIATIAALRAEIESLLVPLNRSAARRVLGRLAREIHRSNSETLAPADDERSHIAAPIEASPVPTPSDPANPGRITLDPNVDSVPPFPPPPRLGSIATLPSGASAMDTEPDGVVLGDSDRAPSALDTQPDAAPMDGDIEPDATGTGPDGTPTIRAKRARWLLLLVLAGPCSSPIAGGPRSRRRSCHPTRGVHNADPLLALGRRT